MLNKEQLTALLGVPARNKPGLFVLEQELLPYIELQHEGLIAFSGESWNLTLPGEKLIEKILQFSNSYLEGE